MKNIAGLAIEKWQFTLVLFLLLIALGVNALTSISRSVDPHFPIPVITVKVIMPGANATDMEETIAKPIEDRIRAVEGFEESRSTISDNQAVIITEFDWDGDPDKYFDDVVREINAIRSSLPEGIADISYEQARTTDAAALQLAVVSDTASWRRMEKYVEDIEENFNRYPDIRMVEINGLATPEVQVAMNSHKMAQLGISPASLAAAINNGGTELPPGTVTSGNKRLNIEAGGAYRNLDDIKNIPIRANNGTVLKLSDLANVFWSKDEQLYKTRVNGERAVFINIQSKVGVDVIRLREKLENELGNIEKILPPDIKLVTVFDQSKDIEHRLSELTRDFSIALFLVIFTLLPLGWRSSAIVMISIPLSLASGLLMIYFMGFNLSQLAVAGFIVALGLLVDDSIVVAENIARHLRMGKRRRDAAVEAVREITPAVLGSTFVLIFAFMPLLFLPEGAGKFTQSFIWSIICTVFASLVISLTIIPFLSSKLLSRDEDPEGNRILQWLTKNIEAIYRPILHNALDKPRRTFWAAMVLTFSAFALIPAIGFSLFPYADTSYFRVTVETEQGATLERTEAAINQVSDILSKEPDIKIRAENIGAANPQVFYNEFGNVRCTDYGEVLAVMDKWRGEESHEMIARLRDKLDVIPGVKAKVEIFLNGAPVASPVALRVTGLI